MAELYDFKRGLVLDIERKKGVSVSEKLALTP